MSNEDNDDAYGFTQPIRIVADPPNKTIWLWKGKKSSVREKFLVN